jgi:hypothetical protein
MQLKKFDSILLLGFSILLVVAYGLYYWRSRQSNIESAEKARKMFYSTAINDTIIRNEAIYKNACDRSIEIAHYSMHDVVVNMCTYPQLLGVDAGTIIQKRMNSNDCIVTFRDGRRIWLNLEIEY